MAIRKWHVGKIVLLWAWGVILCAITIRIIIGTTNALLGLLLVVTLLAILITLSVITWRWLSGKEQ
jgi:hypothetical protein